MINETQIKQLVEDKFSGTTKFIVDLKIKPSNKIEILIDSLERIAISDCVDLSRHIESCLDREQDDFELLVSSSGIDEPFKVLQQYVKNKGREVEIITTDGKKLNGKLLDFENEEVCLETKRIERKEKGKGKETIVEQIRIAINQIKETKLILSFK